MTEADVAIEARRAPSDGRPEADVAIVGAGPAGAAAAWFLAGAGLSVALVDRHTFPRDKPCGEGILPQGAEVLERIGIAGALEAGGARRFRGIRYHAPGGRMAIGLFPGGGRGLGVRRKTLDAALLDAVRANPGVRVEEGFAVHDLLRDPSGRICGIGDGAREIRARLVIGADGHHSRIRTLAGLDGVETARRAVRVHFRPDPPPPPEELVDVYVGGATEAYVTPVGPDEYGVAFLAEGPTSGGEARIRAALAGRGGIAASLAGAPAISDAMAATGVGRAAVSPIADGLLLIGDAAGSPDPITGMGISFALRCASRLAETLSRAFASGDFSARALAPYARMRRREVTGGFAVTRGVLWLAGSDRRAEIAIRALSAAPSIFTALFRLAA